MPSQKSDMNNSFRIIFIIINTIRLILIRFTLYTKNTHFITRKYGVSKIFVNIEYIMIAYKAVTSFLFILLVTNQSGENFNTPRQPSTASSHIFWVLYLSGQYASIKGASEITLSLIMLIYFSCQFGMTFILRLNLSSSCTMWWES